MRRSPRLWRNPLPILSPPLPLFQPTQVAQHAFAKAKETLESGDAEGAVSKLGELIGFLPADDSGWGLRAGHIFAVLVSFYAAHDGVDQASELVATMQQRGIVVEQYLDGATLERIGRGGVRAALPSVFADRATSSSGRWL